jgi:hypothetical protein
MAQNEITTGIGLRHVRLALRGEDGTVEVPSGLGAGVAYAGIRIEGAVALTLTIPDPQRVTARGDDRTYYTFQLPPTDSPTGELRVTKTNMAAVSILTDTEQFGSPPVRKVGFATDKQGLEPAVFIWGMRRAIDSEEGSVYFGQQVWQTYLLLNAIASIRPAAMEDAAVGEFTYAIVANDATVDEFGALFTELSHGFTLCPYVMVITKDKFWIDAFLGSAGNDSFALTSAPSANDVNLVAVDGVMKEEGTDYNITNNLLVFGSAPAAGAKIIAEYTYA